MSHKGTANLKPWRPGQSGNPGGRTRLPPELRAIHALTRVEACRRIAKFARMTKLELEVAEADPNTIALDLSIIAIFKRSMERGDFMALSFLLDQSIGKVPVAIEDDEDRDAREELENLSDQELLRIVKEKISDLSGVA